MSQQDVWDAESAEMSRAFAEKDAEIERLLAENIAFKQLIGELAGAADTYLNLDGSRKIYDAAQLIAAAGNLDYQLKRAREATRSSPRP
jgi:hypothetical protein